MEHQAAKETQVQYLVETATLDALDVPHVVCVERQQLVLIEVLIGHLLKADQRFVILLLFTVAIRIACAAISGRARTGRRFLLLHAARRTTSTATTAHWGSLGSFGKVKGKRRKPHKRLLLLLLLNLMIVGLHFRF